METTYDALVVGGSFAGLSAAMMLARARRRVLVLDAGKPRNRYSSASHGFLGQDGRSPKDIMETGRQQLLAYPTVTFHTTVATEAALTENGFAVTLQDSLHDHGTVVQAKKLILATGLTDHLPDVPGMQDLWGEGVNQCPYCHGYEVAGRKFAIFGAGPGSVHHAAIVSDWTEDATLLTNGGDWLTEDHRAMLAARGIGIEETPLRRLVPRGPSSRELEAVEFTDGRTVPYGALFTGTRWSFASPLAERLGCETEEGHSGPLVKVDFMKETTVSGVFAAGDASNPMANTNLAAASGTLAGTGAHQSLLGLKHPMQAE